MELPQTGQEIQAVPEERSVVAWLGNAPWWLLSAGIHLVVLLAATLVYIEQTLAVDKGSIPVVTRGPERFVDNPEPERDLFTRKGIPKDDDPQAPDVNDDPIIFFPGAEASDHNESANNEDYGQMKGDSKKFLSYLPGDAGGFRGRGVGPEKGVYDTMGVGGGGGGGGRHGGMYGGRYDRYKVGRPSRGPAEDAVIAALRWLARHQSPDGSWKAAGFSDACNGASCAGAGDSDFDVGVTSLSLLAFLGAGYTHMSRGYLYDPAFPGRPLDFGKVTTKAIQWLISRQDAEGCVGPRGSRYMYNHAIASLALAEAYGMTQAGLVRDPAQRAIDFLVAAQNPGKGWRYTAKSGDNDSSITGWAVMALKSAEASELSFPAGAYEGALAWFDSVTDDGGYYRTGYYRRGDGKAYEPGKNQDFQDHPAMTAVAIMSRIFIRKQLDGPTRTAVELLIHDLPEWKPLKTDFYYWYYGSLALFQYDGPEGSAWKKWEGPMKDALIPNQKTRKDACANGSWATEEDRWSFAGGRVYATAVNALTLEVYYRYAKAISSGKK